MSTSLWEALGGVVAAPMDGSPDGRLLAKVVDPCGARIATVVQAPTFPMLVTQPFRLTRAHTVDSLIEQILLDFEEVAERGDGASDVPRMLVELIDALKARTTELPRLEVPPTYADVSTLPGTLERESGHAAAEGIKPRPLNLNAVCSRCGGRWYYLAPAVAAWWRAGGKSRTIVVSDRTDLSKNTSFSFPVAALNRRVETYRRLLALYGGTDAQRV